MTVYSSWGSIYPALDRLRSSRINTTKFADISILVLPQNDSKKQPKKLEKESNTLETLKKKTQTSRLNKTHTNTQSNLLFYL